MVEMLTNKILYRGDDYIHQLMRILEVCGTPREEVLQSVSDNVSKINFVIVVFVRVWVRL